MNALQRLSRRCPLAALIAGIGLAGSVFAADPSLPASVGARLFFDPQLSADGTISCASCHRPERAYADGRVTSIGVRGQIGTRNAPSLIGIARHRTVTWDGRVPSLEAQVLQPFTTRREHGLEGVDQLLARIAQDVARYRQPFVQAFGPSSWPPSASAVTDALAAFVRSLDDRRSGGTVRSSPLDAVLALQIARGQALFVGAAGCARCHRMDGDIPGSDDAFHALGVGAATLSGALTETLQRVEAAGSPVPADLVMESPAVAALGRYLATRRLEDIGRFRTPSLRNVARTAPYFHDGSIATLREALNIELYYRHGSGVRPGTTLSVEEQDDLFAYLRSLTED